MEKRKQRKEQFQKLKIPLKTTKQKWSRKNQSKKKMLIANTHLIPGDNVLGRAFKNSRICC